MTVLHSQNPPLPRIVSLVPSVTELLCTLGLAPWLVGRTGYCIHPAVVVGAIPKVGGTKDVNLAKIARLRATHVIVNVDENTLPTVRALEQMGLRVLVTHPQGPQDNLALIDQIATEFIAKEGLLVLATGLKDQISGALARFSGGVDASCSQQVLYLIWRDPWMTVAQDTYISRMLALIGWQTWPAAHGNEHGAARYPQVDWVQAAGAGIDRVLLSSEPFRFEDAHLAEVQALLPRAGVQRVDGEALSWYGSRCLHGFDLLRQLQQGP